MKKVTKIGLLLLVVMLVAVSCRNRELNTKVSNTTGWNYYDKRTTNFEAQEGITNITPPGMVPVQGGTFKVGDNDEFVTAPRDRSQRSITVSSFYMDKYEITNLNWREYEHWMNIVFGDVAPELVVKVLPDTTVWREELAYNEPYVNNYYRHPAFSFYPVVGITWDQAMAYCTWRTDRVNELSLIKCGEIEYPPFEELRPTADDAAKDEWETRTGYEMEEFEVVDPDDPNNTITMYRPGYDYIKEKFVFNTTKYLLDNDYQPQMGKKPRVDSYGDARKVNTADGILVVGYRLPTEAEFEFAAFAPIAGEDGFTIEGKVYPWSGYHPRNLTSKQKGMMQANFVRGRGDMMGVSGALNDKYVITNPVDEFEPNDFGLYNMAGNVSEWVLDVYREMSYPETSEYNSFRGNIYSRPKWATDPEDENIQTLVYDSVGGIAIEWGGEDDKRDYKDGDYQSIIATNFPLFPHDTVMTQEVVRLLELDGKPTDIKTDPTDILAPKITKKSRVYKGGSWRDRIYWLNPSTRRYLDQDKCSSTIGFRCAMSTVGNQIDPNK